MGKSQDSFNASILDTLTENITVLDANGIMVTVNRAWRRFAAENGLPEARQHWVGVNYLTVCEAACTQDNEADARSALAGIRAVLTGAQPDFSLEYPCHSPHQQRWFQMKVSPLTAPHTGVVITHENITARKRAEAEMRLNEMRLNSLLDLSQKAFQMDEKDMIDLALEEAVQLTESQIGYFHFVNPEQPSIRVLTWSRETLLKDCNAVYEDHYPLEQAAAWADGVWLRQPVVQNDYQDLSDCKSYLEDHTQLLRHMSVPVIYQNQVRLIVGVGNKASDYGENDVRQLQLIANEVWRIIHRRQAENELRQALDRYHRLFMDTPVIGLLIDPGDGALVDANRMALDYYGYSHERITQMKISDINVLPRDQIILEMQRAKEQHRDYFLFQHRLASGEIRDVEVYSGPVQIQGKLLLHSIIRDITDRKRTEAESAALQKQLLDASRKAGMAEIAIGVLHNVGNVLNSINVTVSMLDARLRTLRVLKLHQALQMLRNLLEPAPDTPAPNALPRLLNYLDTLAAYFNDEQHYLLKELRTASEHIEHANHIIQSQQAYALPHGANELVLLTRLLDDAVAMTIADRHAIQVQRYYERLPPILTDKHKLLQIIINLMRNAKDALCMRPTAEEPRQLTVHLWRKEQQVQIEVRDNGVGIAPEHLAQVFAFGFTTKIEGHGFGLHASANLATELGGRLSGHSAGLGQGAHFVLELPFTPAGSSDEPHRVSNP
jgi:PAS domain S-box-containing protein